MAKQLNVNMKFNADSSQAKREIKSLQDSLSMLVATSRDKLGASWSDDLRDATHAAAELSVHLQKAINTKTGNLDFSKLEQSIKKSGISLEQYGDSLRKLGPEGQQAFMQLASAVVQSEVPIRRVNSLVKEFATTLANTARWQLSSSVLHGFMGALQSAYGYAQDLNESLNNIRIVTNSNIDDMARFAQEANKAAKALSTTTTAYTDASLIYFQQGLSEADVKKRADVTIKLANVTRQSAEDVSNQMTAIWNNFYDGSKSLEHYADILSALGAATASSTEEIAGGLEKFAAIADTIGLSYDYAAAALATLTSNTRESEEVVGTALKTIFARIQGLNLGETLEDGTTLNKYSQALATVGINIKDASGNLKDMDAILDAMGSKWDDLSRAQQTALAQTVAGTRQYNQLMALMANWNNGDNDSFKANLATAQGADGTLQKQADIYAESWEAASKRVKTAAEAMYTKLINDEFFIDVLNAVEKIIGFVDNLIDRLGGLKGVLFSIGTILTKIFSDKIAQGMTNAAYNIQMMTKGGREKVAKRKEQFITDAADKMAAAADSGEAGYDKSRAAGMYKMQLERQQQLLDNADKMNDIEKETAQILMDQLKMRGELAIKSAESVEQAKQNLSLANENLYKKAEAKEGGSAVDVAAEEMRKVKQGVDASRKLDSILDKKVRGKNFTANIQNTFEELGITEDDKKRISEYANALKMAEKDSVAFQDAQLKLKAVMTGLNDNIAANVADVLGATVDDVAKYAHAYEQSIEAKQYDQKVQQDATKINEELKESIDNAKGAQQDWTTTLTAGMQAAMAAGSALSMLGDITDTLSDPDISGWEKFTRILTTVSMLIPTLVSMWSSMKTILDKETVAKIKNAAATVAQAIAEKRLAAAKKKSDYLGSLSDKTKKEYMDEAKQKTSSLAEMKKKKGLTWDTNTGSYVDKKGKSYSLADLQKERDDKILNKASRKAAKNSESTQLEYFKSLGKQDQDKYREEAYQKFRKKNKIKYDKKLDTLVDKKGNVYGNVNTIKNSSNLTDQAAKLAKNDALGKGQLGKKMSGGLKAVGGKAAGAVSAAAPYLAIAAGIAVAAGAIAWGKAQFNKYSQAAEDAAKSAESAAAAYQNVTAAYDTFKSNLSNLKDAKDGMKGLVKGTLEYQEAVMKANEAAMALIDSNEDLQYTIDSDGIIQIDEESLQASQKKQMDNLQKAQAAKLISAQNAKEAQTKSDMVDLARSDLKSSQGTWTSIGNTAAAAGAGAGSGALIGAGIGSIIPGIGTAIGAAAGAIIGGVAGLVTGIVKTTQEGSSSKEEQAALEKLGEAFRKDKSKIQAMSDDEFKNYLQTELKIDDAGLIDSMVKNREEVEKLASQIAKNTDASYALNKQLVASALANNQTVQNSQFTEEIVSTTAQFMEDDKAKALKELEDKGFGTKGISKATKVNDAAKDAFKTYMEAAGLEGAELTDTTGTDKNRQFVYKDKDGNEHTVTLEDMKDTIASYNATEQAQTRAAEITKIYNRVGASDKQNAAKLNAAINNDFSKLDAKSMKGGEVATTAQELGITTDAEAIALGYENIEKLNAALAESAERAKTAWTDVVNTHTSSVGTAMKNMSDVAGVSFETLQSYGNMLEKLDQNQVSAFSASMQELAEQAGDQADALLNLASNIDWSQGQSALDQLNGQLYDMGINVEDVTNSDAWTKLQTTINNMSFSVVNQNLDTLREKLKTINEVAKNVKMGDVISDDDYEKLTSVNGSLKQEFVMTADGYMYVGDKDLKEEAASATKTQLENTKNNNVKAKAAYEAMSNMTDVSWQNIADGIASTDEINTSINTLAEDNTVLDALGKTKEQVTEWQDTLNSETATDEQKAAAKERLKELFTEATKLQNNYEAGLYNDRKAEELAASTMSMNELDEAYAEGSGYISKEVYDKFKRVYDAKLEEVELEEAERYHEVNRELEKQEQLLSRINSLKDSAFGKNNRATLIQAETKALLEQMDAQSNYIDEIDGNLQKDKAALNKYGFEFDDSDGSISNFTEIEATQLAAYNQAKKDLALGNIDQEEFDEKEKAWNQFQEDVSKYEGTLDTYSEAQDTLLTQNNQYYTNLVDSYTETLSNASDEIAKYTDRMQHQGKILDHYKNLLSLSGGENDYEKLGAILEGQSDLMSNNLAVSKSTFAMYSEEEKRLKDLMDTAPEGSDAFETYKQQWEAAAEKSREAQDQMLSDLQSWAESEKAILENTLADLGKSLEETLTGGKSFDEVNMQMERAQSLQEEYLTTTNQIYETTKMMRTAQQAIDQTSNTVAKEKLKQFITETKSMQEQGKLSQYELDMQQAKYDLLVAEIALEEAQNAKSTVRLQRDSEGNFGYVYTADANAVADAQQKFDDAENALYNKGLEGANNYAQKYQQTMAEMTSTLQEIQSNYLAGSYADEAEYQTAMEEARSYYTEQLTSYSDLYGFATESNTNIINDAWTSSCDIMSTSVNDVNTAIDSFMAGASSAFEDWAEVVSTVKQTTGSDLTSITSNVEGVTNASDALVKSLLGENGNGGIISELKTGFSELGTIIADALTSWSGLTITVNDDGTFSFKNNSALPADTATNDDGGYTGAWGPSGKLAILHEKEMILTKDETSQFFAHLNMMESILSTLDLYAASQALGGLLTSPTSVGGENGTLEQNVKIEASFPGVTDRNEIEEAFNNLINKASQYANRK